MDWQFSRRALRFQPNIFNVLNPSDVVTMLPLESWGYRRYGRDVWLPQMGDDAATDEMRSSYAASMGADCPVTEDDRAAAVELVERVGASVSSFDELVTPAGLASLVQACLGVDVGRLLASHYPNTYIAWLDATTAADLTFS